MNTVQTVLAAGISILALGGGSWKAVAFMDDRYAPLAAVEDVQWTTLKDRIGRLDQEIAAAEASGNAELVAKLRQDRQDVVDRLCKAFPDDRSCKEAD